MVSVPSGLAWDLVRLETAGLTDLELIGIDLDAESLKLAERLSSQNKSTNATFTFSKSDAWKLSESGVGEVDVITSNGLNIYVQDRKRVVELYKSYASVLKTGGLLITSYMTPPPGIAIELEWNMSVINPEAMLAGKTVFADILDATWQAYMSTGDMKRVLTEAGFEDFEVHYDQAKMFPTITARKK